MHPLPTLRLAGPPTFEQVRDLLAEEVVMHSPLLTKAIVGRDAVARTIVASARNRDDPGRYVLEHKIDDTTTLLHWRGTIEGHEFESLELLVDDAQGRLLERTIAYRPFPALRIFHDKMRALAGDSIPDDAWDYPAA
jgi:hypothetical protein